MVLFMTSCSQQIPNCSDSEVLLLAKDILNKELETILVKEYFSENYNYKDLLHYAVDNGLDREEFINNERKIINERGVKEAKSILESNEIINIRTNFIDKDIKKCGCSADVLNLNLEEIQIDYWAQYTDDKESKLYVELTYKIK